jgi:hypothetical protein
MASLTKDIDLDEFAGEIATRAVAQAQDFEGPLEALHYASHLSYLWEGGREELGRERSDELGRDIVERIARATAPQALVVLRAVAAVAENPVGKAAARAAAELALRVKGEPAWLATVGSPQPVRAGRIEDTDTDEGGIVALDLAWPCGDRGGIAVFIDPRQGGVAKHICVGPSVAEYAEGMAEPFEELDPVRATGLMRAGLAAVEARKAIAAVRVGPTYLSQQAFLRMVIDRIESDAVPRNRAA